MKRIHVMNTLAACALAAAAAACGGSSEQAIADSKFVANAPSYDHVAIVVDDNDASPNSTQTSLDEQALSTEKCHPHLFSRTHEIAGRLNRHSNKMLAHVKDLVADSPKLSAGNTRTWESVKNGVDRKLTLTANADGSFSFELDLAAVAATETFVKVASGSVSSATVTTVTTTNASFSFDFDALHSVVSSEKAAGQLAITGKIVKDTTKPAPGVQKTLTVAFTNFVPEEGDPHGPRTGSFTHLGEPGIGGSLTFSDSLILLCPSNPSNLVADTQTVARWYKASTGGIHGRADAKATGGQMAAGQMWEGVACHNGQPAQASTAANEDAYWMMKLEDPAGNTVSGSARETTDGQANPCDPVFGAVPSLTNNATDYDFTKALTFPGQW